MILECDGNLIQFETVKEAMNKAGVKITHKEATSLLVWRDLFSPIINYKNIRPWQILNRIPFSNVLCLKSEMYKILKDGIQLFPNLYDFIPKTFLLPEEFDSFLNDFITKSNEVEDINEDLYIIKPSNGSLGNGIRILYKGDTIENVSHKSVAQAYIPSYLIDERKFDLRIYVLVTSVDPLEIFVYRDGLARFCSVKSTVKSRFSKLTNVTLNKSKLYQNKSPETISKVLSEFLIKHFDEETINSLWKEIDRIVVLTMFSAQRYMQFGQEKYLPKNCVFYSKCFQIFGFDILLGKDNLKPYLVEVNYRPSLHFMRGSERRMKVKMLTEAIKIAAPYQHVQELVKSRQWSWTLLFWEREISHHPELERISNKLKQKAIDDSQFVKVWPPRISNPLYENVLASLGDLPIQNLVVI